MAETTRAQDDLSHIDWGSIRLALRTGRARDRWLARWAPLTYTDPLGFRDALYRYWTEPEQAGSTPATQANFYEDCVLRHLGRNRTALTWQEDGRKRTLSYDTLHLRSGSLLSAWRVRGVKAGSSVCIVARVGAEYLVALVTALRMGLVVSIVPALGTTFIRNRLAVIGPDFVVLSGGLTNLCPEGVCVLPTTGSDASGPGRSHRYAWEEPVLRVLCPFGDDPLGVVDVAAGDLHAALVRDALLVFVLDEKDVLSMPGFDPLACQPAALLAVLLSGATWAELSTEDLGRHCVALLQHGVTVLGVSAAVREAILAAEDWPLRSVRSWFRSLSDRLDPAAWTELCARSEKAGIVAFNAAFCAAAGGTILFGPTNKGQLDLQAWPAPGLKWQSTEIAAGTLEALNETGILTPLVGDDPIPGVPRMMLTKRGEGFYCAGSIDVGPDAQAYPVEEVSALVETLNGVRGATVVVTRGQLMNEAHVIVVAFLAAPNIYGGSCDSIVGDEIREQIALEMGQRFAPSRVELYGLRPRRAKGGALDRSWCRSQYLGGVLAAKARLELFGLIARLGDLVEAL